MVNAIFDPGDKIGFMYTMGRAKLGKPELFVRDVPFAKGRELCGALNHWGMQDLSNSSTVVCPDFFFTVTHHDKKTSKKLVQSHLCQCKPKALVTELFPVITLTTDHPNYETEWASLEEVSKVGPTLDLEVFDATVLCKDPRPLAEAHPDTFTLPSADKLAGVKFRDVVKICMHQGSDFGERFWVNVLWSKDDLVVGTVGNDLVEWDLPLDSLIAFPRSRIWVHRTLDEYEAHRNEYQAQRRENSGFNERILHESCNDAR